MDIGGISTCATDVMDINFHPVRKNNNALALPTAPPLIGRTLDPDPHLSESRCNESNRWNGYSATIL